mmetsp:Transcript_42791/g.103502  ORF Transcript_42791/g.103502 Transcript_42791/m.103502 type:complete len:440 (+) Transcript_42791:164-1483(+)
MGFEKVLFSETPDDSLLCAICYGVFEDPCSLSCGHIFCRSCLKRTLRVTNKTCPVCRAGSVSDEDRPVEPLKFLIEKLQVKCSNNNHNSEACCQEPDRQRRRTDEEGRSVASIGGNTDDAACSWVGVLADWKAHHNKDCPCTIIKCDIPGCGFTCMRKHMLSHMSSEIAKHTDLIVAQKLSGLEEKFEAKVDGLRERFRAELDYKEKAAANHYLSNFCRQWQASKPDALFDFEVYQSKDLSMTRLLVGIPGPKRTPWEGGLFPVTMEWREWANNPPKCQFPAGFHHINVYPSGTISLSTLNEEEGWDPSISICECLFSIQQLLAHCNPNSPSQSEAYHCYMSDLPDYNEKAKEQAQKWSPNAFLEFAESANFVSLDKCSLRLPWQQDIVAIRPEEPAPPAVETGLINHRMQQCSCSCCAWGSSFWDSKGQMRYLFGVGG